MISLKEKLSKIWNRSPIACTAVIATLGLLLIIGWVHELGHYLAGIQNGSMCGLLIQWGSLHVYCYPIPPTNSWYLPLGGIFGMIGSLSFLLSKRVRNNKGFTIGVYTVAINHFLQTIFETYETTTYLNNDQNLTLLIIFSTFVVFFGLFRFFDPSFFRRRSKKPN